MPNIPYLLGNAGLELHWVDLFGFVKGANTRLLCDASYVHEYFYDFEVSRFQERRIPSTFSLDAGLEQSFGNGRWTVTAKVKNLLDRDLYSEYNQPLPKLCSRPASKLIVDGMRRSWKRETSKS